MWEYILENLLLVTDPNSSLSYAPVLELRHLIVSILGGFRGQLERER